MCGYCVSSSSLLRFDYFCFGEGERIDLQMDLK